MKIILFSVTLLLAFSSHAQNAFPKKFTGRCSEVGTTKKQKSQIGLDFKEFPAAIELINTNDGTRQRAVLNTPLRPNPAMDRYIVLENTSSSNDNTAFTIRYYGSAYSERPYFYEMSVDYSLNAQDQLKTHQLQTTYYKDKVTFGNEWLCEYARY